MKIKVILGATRPGRIGERVAAWVTSVAAEREDFEVELIDLADYPIAHFNEAVSPRYNPARKPGSAVAKWLEKISEADGVVFVTPEYNHSIPGILKDALDYLDFQSAKKPAAIVSYGTVGGARAAEQLKLILIEAKMAVVPEAIALISPTSVLADDGTFTGDATSPYGPAKQLPAVLEQLAWWTKALKAARD
jgi:NAD(P)H-dependent FMN reductase